MTPSFEAEPEETLSRLTDAVRAFASERDWDQFHDPKNLAMAIGSEAGELTAILRWVSNADADALVRSQPERARIEAEVGDIGICLLQFCSRSGIDLGEAIRRKLELNAEKYPVSIARGRPDPPANSTR